MATAESFVKRGLLTVLLWCHSAGGGETRQISGLLRHRPGEGRDSGGAQRHPPEGSITPISLG